MSYPDTYDDFRETENRPDVVYDPNQKRRVFAEDINNATAAIAAIQATLGLNPDEGYGTVVEYVNMVYSYAQDAYDYADQAYSMADQAYSEVMSAWDMIWDLDSRVSGLGG